MNTVFSIKRMTKGFAVAIMLLLFVVYESFGTHLRAGEITVERINCSRTFKITIRVYTNIKDTNVEFGGDGTAILSFGDGLFLEVPTVAGIPRPELSPDNSIAYVEYTQTHVYSSDGSYTITYKEPNRNRGVLNMDNSVETQFYIETTVNIDPYFGCSSSPVLSVPPIDRGCVGVAWSHNPGAYDVDGDLLTYELVVPNRDRNVSVTNYKSPSDAKFYTSFGTGNENGNGPPSFKIDQLEGTITWDAPGAVGEYNIAFIVREWRLIDGLWFPLGSVRRDMQIIIDDCQNERPDLEVPQDTCVTAGTTLKEQIKGTDPDVDDKIKIEAFSQIFNFPPAQSPATFLPVPDFRPQPYNADFEWETDCFHIREQPYQVVFKVTDDGPPRLTTFKSWFIKVVAPAPQWKNITLNPSTRSTVLEWEDYPCTQADVMQVWRRVDKTDYEPDNCETGMPGLGYTLLAEVPISGSSAQKTFTDSNNGKGLPPGAEVCYRLVAVFPLPGGGESYVSKDTCIGPILADAPVITNVSIVKTDAVNGEIFVKWFPPVDADPVQFPPPYTYKAYRGLGFTGSPSTNAVYSGTTTSFTDIGPGLNTENDIYNYRIVCYDASGGTVDTSAVASSVRLETNSLIKKIELVWRAEVPWSNQTEKYPRHLIFRGEGDAEPVLIDSVDVTANGFTYVDEGQFNKIPLVDGQTYCYKIETRGSYGGTPDKFGKLKNLSQIICTQPGDTIPPCKPIQPLTLNAPDCNTYSSCGENTFKNTLTWDRPEDPECRNDIRSYNIYVSYSADEDYMLLTRNVTDLFYVHDSLNSMTSCYKISAVDRSGNESELSDPVCFENCPYYELPNVFTPNGDECNSTFSAYNSKDSYIDKDESGEIICGGTTDETKCARFVEKVVLHVYNRWGREVYNYASEEIDDNDDGVIKSIYIDWDGRDTNGNELSSGVYYYVADVTFDTYDPAKKNKTIKGWVQLVR